MAIKMKEFIRSLPQHEQEAIAKRSAELLAEEASLRELRKRIDCSQDEVAKKLHIKQSSVSKLEKRADMYISTLRSYIEAMGGKLEITAQFPGALPIRISQFEGLT